MEPPARHRISDATGLPPRWLWAAYAAVWVVIGLLLSIAELQHYLRRGGPHPWEPFLWELSSTFTSSLLMVGIFRWHEFLFARPRPLLHRLGGHVLGLGVYVLLHCAGMYGIRAVAYAATGVAYHPGGIAHVLAYEGAKDAVYYALFVMLCQALLLFLRHQAQRSEWQRLNEELAQARLARLAGQIQPHFLFNTLNLVSSVMYESVARADRILSELADLLRRSIDAGRQHTHSLAAELTLVEPFLSIMRQRFEDRLTVTVDASEAARACAVPSLLLIAPLENAVTHGVACSTSPTALHVSAHTDGGMLELVVADSAGRLERDGRPGGIGLANTRERLAAMYGDAASVTLACEGAATVLRIRLPREARRMRLLIVDDEPPARAKLRRFLSEMADVEVAGEAGDGEAALAAVAEAAPDAVLLDIQMPGASGLEVAAALPSGVMVAFTTAYDEFAVHAFELNAVDYLLKPFTRERLEACIARLRQRLPTEARAAQRQGLLAALHSLQPVPGHWMVAHRGALHRVPLAEVEVVEAADNYVELHTATASWLDRTTLAAFLAHPASGRFVRVHRSAAVNAMQIARVAPLPKGDAELTTASGRVVRVSRRFRDALLASTRLA